MIRPSAPAPESGTPQRGTPRRGAPEPPIVTVSTVASGLLSVDPSCEECLEHVRSHGPLVLGADAPGVHIPDVLPAPEVLFVNDLLFFDARGRRLGLLLDGAPELVVIDDRPRDGELRARIEELLAHMRVRAYEDPNVLEGSGVRDPQELCAPDRALPLPDYLQELSYKAAGKIGSEYNLGSYWHNLWHRLGG